MTPTKKMKAGTAGGIREKLLARIRKTCEEAEAEIEELMSSAREQE